MKKERAIPFTVNIAPSDNNGYIVVVGCATLVFSDRESLELALHEYLRKSENREKGGEQHQ